VTPDAALLILDGLLQPKVLTQIQEFVFRQTWAGDSYAVMAEQSGYDEDYIKDVGSRLWKQLTQVLGIKVTKNSLTSAFGQYARGLPEQAPPIVPQHQPTASSLAPVQIDWGEAMEVYSFYGREAELQELHQWVTLDRARLVAIVGMGGMGKSALAVRLVERLLAQTDFELTIWRSLRNAPPVDGLLIDLIQFLSRQQEMPSSLPTEIPALIQKLLQYLRASRCLLVLDNVETILRSTDPEYGELLRQLGETRHQSCVLLTSREKPSTVAILEGNLAPVRSLLLRGLPSAQAQAIFAHRANFVATDADWEVVVGKYAGNPLALKIVACAIAELFAGNVTKFVEFLQTQTIVFDDIRDLLDRQFDRLTDAEREVMMWLAIEREFVDLVELQGDSISPSAQRRLPETLRSLVRKSLIETQGKQFTQQPVVMEYITEKIVERVTFELKNWQPNIEPNELAELFLHRYALTKVTSKDYVRNSQIRTIFTPILDAFKAEIAPEHSLLQILDRLRLLLRDTPTYSIGNLIDLLRSMGTDFTGFDFSHLCVWQADLRNLPLHRVNFQGADLSKSNFSESLGGVFCAAFHPDGIRLVAGDAVGLVSLWNHHTAQQLQIFDRGCASVSGVAVSPDGCYVAAVAAATIKIWQIETGECLQTIAAHFGSWVPRLVFSADSRTLMSSGGEDGSVRLWDVATGACQQMFEFACETLYCDFSPDNRSIAVALDDRTITLWERSTGKCLRTFRGHQHQVWCVVFSPDGNTLVSGSTDRSVKIWQVDTGECRHTCNGHGDQVWRVAVSPDGNTIASTSTDDTVKLWSLHTGQCTRTLEGFGAHVYDADFSPDGMLLATSSMDQTLRIWDVATGACRRVWRGYRNDSWGVKFLPCDNGYLLGAAWRDGITRIWQLPDGNCLGQIDTHQDWNWSIHPLSDTAALALGIDRGLLVGTNATLQLWNLADATLIRNFSGHQGDIICLTDVGTEARFVSGSMDRTLRLWDIETGECLHVFSGHQHWVWCVASSPAERLLASASFDGTTKVWDLDTFECLRTLDSHIGQICGVVFSRDGQQIITSATNSAIAIWDTHSGTQLHTLTGHQGWVTSLAISPDGTLLASGSIDNTVRLWDLRSMTCVQVLTNHTQWVGSVAFSPDGRLLVSAGCDEILWIWDVESARYLQSIAPERLYAGMNIANAIGLTEAQKLTLRELGAIG
jgi:WD40 repeat protein